MTQDRILRLAYAGALGIYRSKKELHQKNPSNLNYLQQEIKALEELREIEGLIRKETENAIKQRKSEAQE